MSQDNNESSLLVREYATSGNIHGLQKGFNVKTMIFAKFGTYTFHLRYKAVKGL